MHTEENAAVRIVQYGLGPIGAAVTRLVRERPGMSIVGAVDVDPAKHGRDVGELAGGGALGVRVEPPPGEAGRGEADVAVITTTSSLEKITPQVLDAVERGLHVVTTCEELSYPWRTDPERARMIDEAAARNGVAVVSTGVNPGFLMDFLPLVLTGVCRRVERITVERIQDAAFRRVPFQRKIGAGLTLEEFEARVEDGTLRHVGLTESMHMVGDVLGWDIEKTEDVVEPLIAAEEIDTGELRVGKGCARGVMQTGRAWAGGAEVITLVFRAGVGEPDPRDRILVEGEPRIESLIPGGVNGDTATCAVVVNAVAAVMRARPGLRTMADMPLVSCSGGIR